MAPTTKSSIWIFDSFSLKSSDEGKMTTESSKRCKKETLASRMWWLFWMFSWVHLIPDREAIFEKWLFHSFKIITIFAERTNWRCEYCIRVFPDVWIYEHAFDFCVQKIGEDIESERFKNKSSKGRCYHSGGKKKSKRGVSTFYHNILYFLRVHVQSL